MTARPARGQRDLTEELDQVTQDMLIGQCGQLEQFRWFVRAHLETPDGSLVTGKRQHREDGRPITPRSVRAVPRQGLTTFRRKISGRTGRAFRLRSQLERDAGFGPLGYRQRC